MIEHSGLVGNFFYGGKMFVIDRNLADVHSDERCNLDTSLLVVGQQCDWSPRLALSRLYFGIAELISVSVRHISLISVQLFFENVTLSETFGAH